MWNPLQRKPKSVLGIDVGTCSVKIMELSSVKEKKELTNYGFISSYGYFERFNNAIQTSSLRMLDSEVASILRDIIKEARISTLKALISIPVFSSFSTVIELPLMSKSEIVKAIPFQARQYIPIPINEVILDWRIIPPIRTGSQSDKTSVLLVAVPKEVIAKYTRIAKLSGITPLSLEVESFCLARSLLGNDTSPTLLLDIGGRSTTICVVDGGYIRVSHNLDTSGEEFTRVISQGMAISLSRAEELKKEHGLRGRGGESEISNIIIPIIDIIFIEVEKIINLYQRKTARRIEKIVLTGGSAGLPGLVEYFVEKLGVETAIGDPFSYISYPTILKSVLKCVAPGFAVGVGLAMREL